MAEKTSNYATQFDFGAYYGLIKNAPAGLRLFLAQQLLDNASQMMGRAQKELRAQIEDMVDEIEEVRKLRQKFYDAQERSTNVTA